MGEYYLSLDPDGDVLLHHGVKGMKWGQHIFGKVTTSVKNKWREEKAAKEGRKIARKEASNRRRYALKYEVKSMSDDELQKKIDRLNLEKRYLDVRSQVMTATKPQQTFGEKIMEKAKDGLTNGLNQVASKAMLIIGEKMTKKIVGESELTKLTQEADLWNKKKQIAEYKKNISDMKSPNKDKEAEKEMNRLKTEMNTLSYKKKIKELKEK